MNPLAITSTRLGVVAKERKLRTVQEAISWPKGSDPDQQLFYRLYDVEDFLVGVRKPGKESLETPPNPNDMLPTIKRGGTYLEYKPGFNEIFSRFQDLGREWGENVLDLVGALLCRSAYLLDHDDDEEGNLRWRPPSDVVTQIERHAPTVGDLPVMVFLHLVEVLALQEDVKYHTLGRDISKGIGRTNNLLTCAHIIAIFLGRANIVAFAYALSNGRGVAGLSQAGMKRLFPRLSDTEN